jgi:hypothetical protein
VFYTTDLIEVGRANDAFSGDEAATLLRYLEQSIVNKQNTTS